MGINQIAGANRSAQVGKGNCLKPAESNIGEWATRPGGRAIRGWITGTSISMGATEESGGKTNCRALLRSFETKNCCFRYQLVKTTSKTGSGWEAM